MPAVRQTTHRVDYRRWVDSGGSSLNELGGRYVERTTRASQQAQVRCLAERRGRFAVGRGLTDPIARVAYANGV